MVDSSQKGGMVFLSRTMMGRDEQAKLYQLIATIYNAFDSIVFRDPVDWKTLNLMDYLTIVTKPMDLATVKKRIANRSYENVEDCLQEIGLIWENAKTYNPKEHEIHKLADKFQKQTKKMIRNYLPFVKMDAQALKKRGVAKKEQPKPQIKLAKVQQPKTYLQKQQQVPNPQHQSLPAQQPHITARKNSLLLFQLCSKEQIGVIFLLIKSNCPQAIDYDENGMVNVHGQKLNDILAKRLNNLVEMWGVGTKQVLPIKKK